MFEKKELDAKMQAQEQGREELREKP